MNILKVAVWGIGAFVVPVHASVVLGLIGTESGVPGSGLEDVAIYNLTGPLWGCSTPAGTPVCTATTFENVQLTINGSTLNLGNIDPGVTETYTIPGGTFVDGTINSLSFSATLSSTVLTDDLGNTLNVDSSLLLTGIPTDGSLPSIEAALASSVPEPSWGAFLLGLSLLAGAALARGRRSLS